MRDVTPQDIIDLRDALAADIETVDRIAAGYGNRPEECQTALGEAAGSLVLAERAQLLGSPFAAHGYAQDALAAGSKTPAGRIIEGAALRFRVPHLAER